MNSSSFCVVVVFGLFALINLCGAQEKCTPGETKMEDCNTCFCTDGGIWGCTLKACDVNIRPKRQDEISKECTPGDKKKLECNDCFCSETGIWACTLKACLTNIPQIDEVSRTKREAPVAVDLMNTPCAPNDYFKIDCNTCYCKTDKTGYLCTQNVCTGPDHKDILTTSEPDEYVVNKTRENTTTVSHNNNEENGLLLSHEDAPSASGRSAGSDPIFQVKSTGEEKNMSTNKTESDLKINEGVANNATNLEPAIRNSSTTD